jgi:spore germination protein GerM
MKWILTPWNIIAVLILAGVLGVRYLQTRPTPLSIDARFLQDEQPRSKLNLNLYFIDATGQNFAREQRDAGLERDDLETRAGVAVKNFLEGPRVEGSISLLPKNVAVPTVFANKDTVYVDLQRSWANVQLGTRGELLLYCGLANTLLDMEGVSKVKFLMAGKSTESVGGHIPLDQALTKRECQQ